jgi:hypothetical protein
MRIIRQYVREYDIQCSVIVDDEWAEKFIADYKDESGYEPSFSEIYDAFLSICENGDGEVEESCEPAGDRECETWIDEAQP